jgi:hypothetical protein
MYPRLSGSVSSPTNDTSFRLFLRPSQKGLDFLGEFRYLHRCVGCDDDLNSQLGFFDQVVNGYLVETLYGYWLIILFQPPYSVSGLASHLKDILVSAEIESYPAQPF